ncbi:MAG: four helix bundle protein [Bacteroidota bacterium]
MKENIVQNKAFAFAVRIVTFYKHYVETHKEYVLSKQLLRSGTSIGANIEEAIGGVSKADFSYKIGIAYKEARETRYWIKLLKATDYIDQKTFESFFHDIEELCKLLASILKSSRS